MNEEGEKDLEFERIYTEVFPTLIKVAYHIVGNIEAAEDICQEAFIRFYKKGVVFVSRVESRYWLIRVVKNLSFNYYKRKSRERKAVRKLENESSFFDEGGINSVFEKETERIVKEALASLPDKLRSVLVLKVYGGLTYKEIAKILHISENNVKIRVFRARDSLMKMIDREDVHVL